MPDAERSHQMQQQNIEQDQGRNNPWAASRHKALQIYKNRHLRAISNTSYRGDAGTWRT